MPIAPLACPCTLSDNIFAFIGANWWLIGLLLSLTGALIYTERRKGGRALNPAAATLLINIPETVSLDLRPEADFQRSHIAGCNHIAADGMLAHVQATVPDLEKPVLLICATGAASRTAAAALKRAGYRNVSLLSGGIRSWQTENLPLVSAQSGGGKTASKAASKATPKKIGKGGGNRKSRDGKTGGTPKLKRGQTE